MFIQHDHYVIIIPIIWTPKTLSCNYMANKRL